MVVFSHSAFYFYEKWQLNNKSALASGNFRTIWAANSISCTIHIHSGVQEKQTSIMMALDSEGSWDGESSKENYTKMHPFSYTLITWKYIISIPSKHDIPLIQMLISPSPLYITQVYRMNFYFHNFVLQLKINAFFDILCLLLILEMSVFNRTTWFNLECCVSVILITSWSSLSLWHLLEEAAWGRASPSIFQQEPSDLIEKDHLNYMSVSAVPNT